MILGIISNHTYLPSLPPQKKGTEWQQLYKNILRPVLDGLQLRETQENFFVMKTHSPALLSLGTRRKKISKVKNKNISFVHCSWSDIAMTGKCKLCERGRVRHAHRQALLISKWELQSSRHLQRDANPPSKGLVLLACLKSQVILWLLKWKITPKEMPDFY